MVAAALIEAWEELPTALVAQEQVPLTIEELEMLPKPVEDLATTKAASKHR